MAESRVYRFWLLAAAIVTVVAMGVIPVLRYFDLWPYSNPDLSDDMVFISGKIERTRPVNEVYADHSSLPAQPISSTKADEAQLAPVFFVLPAKTNQSATNVENSANNSDVVTHILENIVQASGARLVERRNFDNIINEFQFNQTALVDKGSRVKLGHVIGANTFIESVVEDIQIEKSSFSGYGTKFETLAITAIVQVKVVRVDTAEILFSARVENAPEVIMRSEYGKSSSSSVVNKAIEGAVQSLASNSDFKRVLLGNDQRQI